MKTLITLVFVSTLSVLSIAQEGTYTDLKTALGEPEKVKVLDLHAKGIATIPNDDLAKFVNLEELNLSGNKLHNLPKSLGNLAKLKKLDVSYNQLDQMESVPSSIGKLVELEKLNLEKNLLFTLPGEIGQLKKLKVLNLSMNKFSSLPDELGSMTSLELITLKANPTLEELPESLKSLKNLKKLILKFCRALPTTEVSKVKKALSGCEVLHD